MSTQRCFDLLERTVSHNNKYIITVEVYGSAGTKLFKGNMWNVPFHVCYSFVESYDFENYHLIIRLK